jgi:hypothetical protein
LKGTHPLKGYSLSVVDCSQASGNFDRYTFFQMVISDFISDDEGQRNCLQATVLGRMKNGFDSPHKRGLRGFFPKRS